MELTKNTKDQIESVQIEGLVALKIVKHCHEEGPGEIAQGDLLGLLVDKTLEVTNCFPRPRNEDDEYDDENYQIDMMRKLREVNVDHFHVGWYQSTCLGSFLNRNFVESQFHYQRSIEESVVLVYDPLQTHQGMLSFKAYRLSQKMLDLYAGAEKNFTPEMLIKENVDFTNILEEVPVTIKTSNLVNTLICEIEETVQLPEKEEFLSLATGSYLEKNVHLLIEGADELCQDSQKLHNFQRNVARQQQQIDAYKQRRAQENDLRKQRGEQPLPDEDLNKLFRPLQPPQRLDNLLATAQIATCCDQLNDYAAQSFSKLFLAESIQKLAEA
ncbi:eukaryotic translation initiation factor 3 subunit H [Hydra vulgaris]|uniref:Eukaryotic translation initiation factor 3 subunit H n=1 Tax=Hydra vulgaris TaxID=6087 RepID=A0ABM4D6M4_HYDVU